MYMENKIVKKYRINLKDLFESRKSNVRTVGFGSEINILGLDCGGDIIFEKEKLDCYTLYDRKGEFVLTDDSVVLEISRKSDTKNLDAKVVLIYDIVRGARSYEFSKEEFLIVAEKLN